MSFEYPRPRSCPSCGVLPNCRHLDGCDWARCTNCGSQHFLHIGCEKNNPKPSMHNGYYPGELECYEYEMFTDEDSIWGFGPDLNTFLSTAYWSKRDQRYYPLPKA